MKTRNLAKIITCFSLLLGGIQTNANAAIITVPLNYTTDAEDDQALTLSGNFVINTDLDGGNQRSSNFSLRNNKQTIPNWITSITLNLVDSNTGNANGDMSGTFTKSDFSHLIWDPKEANVGSVNFDNDLVSQFDDLGFAGVGNLTSSATFNQDRGDDEFILTSTPLPIPFIGFLSIFSFVKKLKKIKGYTI